MNTKESIRSLSVNLNAIAMLRNRRDLPWPNILHFAEIALNAGAKGITVHPRPDQRHIRFQDVFDISAFLKEKFPKAEFNIEGYPSEEFLALAMPYAQQITLVPDTPEQKTSDHGWDFVAQKIFLKPIVEKIKKNAIRVSLFSDPKPEGLEIAKTIGADRVEFYTGPYAAAYADLEKQKKELMNLQKAGLYAREIGLEINAGHDLTCENLPDLLKAVPNIAEVSIGHALVARALEEGMKATVENFCTILKK